MTVSVQARGARHSSGSDPGLEDGRISQMARISTFVPTKTALQISSLTGITGAHVGDEIKTISLAACCDNDVVPKSKLLFSAESWHIALSHTPLSQGCCLAGENQDSAPHMGTSEERVELGDAKWIGRGVLVRAVFCGAVSARCRRIIAFPATLSLLPSCSFFLGLPLLLLRETHVLFRRRRFQILRLPTIRSRV